MTSAPCYIETKGPMEAFGSGIYPSLISSSASTASIKSVIEMQICS
jgi:hypothetical protein